MSPTAKQARRAAKKERRRHGVHNEIWPEPLPEIPPETVCDRCGFTAIVLPDPREEFVTPCLLCGNETGHYKGEP